MLISGHAHVFVDVRQPQCFSCTAVLAVQNTQKHRKAGKATETGKTLLFFIYTNHSPDTHTKLYGPRVPSPSNPPQNDVPVGCDDQVVHPGEDTLHVQRDVVHSQGAVGSHDGPGVGPHAELQLRKITG